MAAGQSFRYAPEALLGGSDGSDDLVRLRQSSLTARSRSETPSAAPTESGLRAVATTLCPEGPCHISKPRPRFAPGMNQVFALCFSPVAVWKWQPAWPDPGGGHQIDPVSASN